MVKAGTAVLGTEQGRRTCPGTGCCEEQEGVQHGCRDQQMRPEKWAGPLRMGPVGNRNLDVILISMERY